MTGGDVDKWRNWFCIAVIQLNMAPDQFWRLSLHEWEWLLSALFGDAQTTLNAETLNALVKQYPDKQQ